MNEYYYNFLKKMKSTQDHKKIIENLLNGKVYVEFQFKFYDKLHFDKLILEIKLRSSTKNIPNFLENSIYLPFIKDFNIENYIENLEEFRFLKILKITNNKEIVIDLKESVENLNKNEFKFNSHDLKIKTNEEKEEFKYNYTLIYTFIKSNYKQNEVSKNAFLINFDVTRKILRLEKVKYDHILKDLDILFYVKEDNSDLRTLFPFNVLSFKYKSNDIVIDIKQSVEKINLFNNIKNF